MKKIKKEKSGKVTFSKKSKKNKKSWILESSPFKIVVRIRPRRYPDILNKICLKWFFFQIDLLKKRLCRHKYKIYLNFRARKNSRYWLAFLPS